MNRAEWITDGRHLNEYRRYVNHALKQWKLENNIIEKCVVHHRDDTEETRKYNSEHYERWGFNENGEFIEGQYVIFMTLSEHTAYHHIGKISPRRGKKCSEETCEKISVNNARYWKDKKLSDETRDKISAANKGRKLSDETRAKMSATRKGKKFSEEHRAKMSATKQGEKVLYVAYKNNGGILKWNDFRKALSNGKITFEVQPISVYTKEINK